MIRIFLYKIIFDSISPSVSVWLVQPVKSFLSFLVLSRVYSSRRAIPCSFRLFTSWSPDPPLSKIGVHPVYKGHFCRNFVPSHSFCRNSAADWLDDQPASPSINFLREVGHLAVKIAIFSKMQRTHSIAQISLKFWPLENHISSAIRPID
jgi:hypothetical protein